jgi:S1-C subfamily serine protease
MHRFAQLREPLASALRALPQLRSDARLRALGLAAAAVATTSSAAYAVALTAEPAPAPVPPTDVLESKAAAPIQERPERPSAENSTASEKETGEMIGMATTGLPHVALPTAVPGRGPALVRRDERPLTRSTVADAVASAGPSVVSVRVMVDRRARGRTAMQAPDLFGGFFHMPQPEGYSRDDIAFESSGSGVIASFDGDGKYTIVTNWHVLHAFCSGCESCDAPYSPYQRHLLLDIHNQDQYETVIQVELTTGEVLEATLEASDSLSDLAILRVDSEKLLPVAVFGDSDIVRPGELVVAIGSPLEVLTNSCSLGIVSSVRRDIETLTRTRRDGLTFLQVTAPVNGGNSGGGLCDLDGKVLGINTLRVADGLGHGGLADGIGFAIPSNYVKSVVAELREHGRCRRPFIGLALVVLDEDAVLDMMHLNSFFLPPWLTGSPLSVRNIQRGLLVERVDSGSPAADAKLARGDIIVAVDGKEISSISAWMAAIAFKLDSATIKMSVYRAEDGALEDVYVTPTTREENDD